MKSMINLKSPPVIIVLGAARSGTSLLASLIFHNYRVKYIAEINEVWKKFVPACALDSIPTDLATPERIVNIREHFLSAYADGSETPILEKTAANSLRPEFVYRVFPNAIYIHIVRDGRDVALSVKKKCEGDLRKISKDHAPVSSKKTNRFVSLYGIIRRKLEHGVSLKYILQNAKHYVQSALCVLGLCKATIWGPQFADTATIDKMQSLLEVGAQQWKHSVDAMLAFREAHPEATLYELKYEDLIANPDRILSDLFLFIDLPEFRKTQKTVHNVFAGGNNWQDILRPEDLALIEPYIKDSLRHFGYQW